ncbi:hypothetical protein [uncultured Veillonella sp.]
MACILVALTWPIKGR